MSCHSKALSFTGGSSSLASGQGTLESLGVCELILGHNSMKRSDSSATSSSISNLAISLTSGVSKSPTQQQSDWNQTFFGSKQNKVSEEPVAKVEKPDAAITTAADSVLYSSSPPLLVADRVPSIIIQDSFIVEKSSLPPSASPSSSKLNSSTVPVPKARNTMNNKVPVEVDLPAIVPPSRRKDLATVEEMPTMEVYSQPAGVSARPRMSSSQTPPSSFPVGVARPPPVAKPSRPFPPSSTKYFLPLSSDLTIDPIVPPEREIQISPSQIKPIPLNLFDSDSDDEEDSISEDDNRGRLNVTYIPVQSSKARLSTIAEESDESFWEMLENLVIEHDLTTYHTIRTTAIRFSDAPPPKPVAPSDALEEYEELNEADDDWLEAESADVFFSDQTVELSAVEKIDDYLGRVAVSLQTSGHSEETPKNSSPKEFRRSRLFSISTSQTDTEPKSTKIHLDGLDDDSKADTSRGFGGSDHLSSAPTIAWDSAPTIAWNSDLAMTSDSAVYVTEEYMRPHDDAVYTPQPGTTQLLIHKPVRPRVYQGKSNEELMGLLEERDSEMLDLKAYLDSLLLKVIADCPHILQTPVRTSQRK